MTPQECAAMGEMMGSMMGSMMGQMTNGGMMDAGWTWGSMAWFGLLALAVVVAIGLAVGLLVGRRTPGPAGDDPREIVRRRFARGELTAEELADAMKTLG